MSEAPDPFAGYEQQTRITVTPHATGEGGNGTGAAFGLTSDAGSTPAPHGSGLALYRKRAQAARESRYLDLHVPDSGDPDVIGDPESVFVRYRALTKGEMTAIGEKWSSGALPEQEWGMTVDALTTACVGVFQVDDRGFPIGSPSSWPKFGPELAADMGITLSGSPGEQASQLLKEFYVSDVDAVNVGDRIANYSNRVNNPVAERQNPEA